MVVSRRMVVRKGSTRASTSRSISLITVSLKAHPRQPSLPAVAAARFPQVHFIVKIGVATKINRRKLPPSSLRPLTLLIRPALGFLAVLVKPSPAARSSRPDGFAAALLFPVDDGARVVLQCYRKEGWCCGFPGRTAPPQMQLHLSDDEAAARSPASIFARL